MTSYERFICAIERGQPDRVPIYEGYIHPKIVEALCPGGDYHDLIEELDLDMVRITEGNIQEFIDEERRVYRDKWGTTFQLETETTGYPVAGPIQNKEDLKAYRPPDPMDPLVYRDLPAALDRFKGKRTVIWRGLDGFSVACQLRGMENLLTDYLLNPSLAHELMEICNTFQTRVAVEAVRRGVDAVVLLDDYADKNGPIMGPKLFEEFVLPYLARTVRAIKEVGAYVIKHTDGNIWSILEQIVETGIDAINPLEPVASMEIGEAKQRYGNRVCLIGNIDCGTLLCRGTPEAVREEVQRCIQAAAPGGGYILSSSNSLQSGVKPENYLAMVEEGKRYGSYPLKLD